MQKERATCEESAQTQHTRTAQRVTHACDCCAFVASAGRVLCARSASNFIETCAIPSESREVFPQISVQKALQSSEIPARPAQHASNDCASALLAFCVRLRLRSRWFSRIATQNSRGFRPKNCASSVSKERASRKERAQNQQTCVAHCFSHFYDVCAFFGRCWARVGRKKCVEFHRNFRDFRRKS